MPLNIQIQLVNSHGLQALISYLNWRKDIKKPCGNYPQGFF